MSSNPLWQAIIKTTKEYRCDPLDLPPAADFNRWCIRTPERWVELDALPVDERGRVKVGGETVAIWKYVVAILRAAGIER